MDSTVDELRQELKCYSDRSCSVEEWSSATNVCILLALKEAPIDQYGLVKFYVRRALEGFQVAHIIHNRRLEGTNDMTIVLNDPKEESLPLTWMDWFRRTQSYFTRGPIVDLTMDTSGQLKAIIEHLDMVYHELEKFQSNAEGLKTHVGGYII